MRFREYSDMTKIVLGAKTLLKHRAENLNNKFYKVP